MDILKKNQIEYIVDKYFKNQHKVNYSKVIDQFKYYVKSSNFSDEEFDQTEIGGYLVFRINGMPSLQVILN